MMTVAYGCVLIFILMPYVLAGVAKRRMKLRENSAPRAYLAEQTGSAQRANWAQNNTFETLPGFIAGVLIAHQLHAHQLTVDALAVSFIGFRVVYAVSYILNRPTLRSLAWTGALLCVIGFFVAGALTQAAAVS
jgi:uncharacterized MAPEG superfamily protein